MYVLRGISRFLHSKSGNVAVTFAIAALPILTGIGCAIDYSLASRIKSKLQSAADGAVVASISATSPGYIAASAMLTDGSVPSGVADANNVFYANMSGVQTSTAPVPVTTVTKTGITLTSTINFTASIATNFLGVIGIHNITVGGTSTASATLPAYLDFYVALDVSGSMGMPSTTSPNGGEVARMQQVSPDNFVQYPTGCTLACHFAPQNSACTDSGTQGYPTNGYCLGYAISRVSQSGYQNLLQLQSPQGKYPYINSNPHQAAYGKYQQLPSSMVSGLPNSLYSALTPVTSCPTAGTDACIQLRLDAVGVALNSTMAANGLSGLFELANQKKVVASQFRIGLYPFILDIDANYAPLTSSINGSASSPGTINYAAVNLATELDTNLNSTLGSGGTHIDTALSSINGLISSVGTGSSAVDTQPYLFLVTDGAQDPQIKGVPNGGWSGSNHATVLSDPTNSSYSSTICATIKNRGIKIAVLYIPYQKINPVNASFANDEDDYANNNIPNIPTSLKNCASPPDVAGSYFYTANTPTDITNALAAMFNHSLVSAHITN